MEKVRLFNVGPFVGTLDYLVKQLVLLVFCFFTFYADMCMFHQTAKIFSNSGKD